MEALPLHEIHKICRICLKNDILVSIFSPTFLIRPIEMLQKLNFKVTEESLPSLLCQSCLYRLLDAYNLQQLAEASENRIREYFGISTAAATSNATALGIGTTTAATSSIAPPYSTADMDNKSEGDCSSVSMYNICDMMFDRHDDMVEVVGTTDDVLNDVEIDVSSLTRSEADENTLGDVFTKTRMSFDNDFKIQEPKMLPLPEKAKKAIDMSFRKSKKISVKLLSKTLKTPDECLECGKIFHYKGYLEIHKRVHTGEKPFKCQICSREFITSTKLVLHQRTHSTDKSNHKRFQCEICSAFFATSSNLNAHKLTHAIDRKYPCQDCNMSFKSARDLKRHEPMHPCTKQSVTIFCGICEKSFTKRASLNAHMITVHRRIRKHACTECDKIFGKKSNLINHMRIHSGEKPFDCPSCSWKFAQSSALKRHMKKHSKGPPILVNGLTA